MEGPWLVYCNGICTVEYDHYCGIHLPNETCIACDRTWQNAHEENEKRGCDFYGGRK
jgi:hypothetical protein